MNLAVWILLSLVGLYLIAGFIACVAVDIEDLKKKRISAIGALSGVADIHGLGLLIYLLLWPVWYFAYKKADGDGKQTVVISYDGSSKTLKEEEPNQTSQHNASTGSALSSKSPARRG